jgi:hypothetical protein
MCQNYLSIVNFSASKALLNVSPKKSKAELLDAPKAKVQQSLCQKEMADLVDLSLVCK